MVVSVLSLILITCVASFGRMQRPYEQHRLPHHSVHRFSGNKNIGRVYSGIDVDFRQYPYVVSLVTFRKMRFCTGSLITNDWVLSAAHCAVRNVGYVRHGDMTVNISKTKPEDYRKILKKLRHSGWEQRNTLLGNYANDFGLFMIETLNLEVGKLCAIEFSTLIGKPVKYFGFGQMFLDEDYTYDLELANEVKPLQMGEGVVIKCQKHNYAVTQSMVICTAPKCSRKEQGTLGGDSGGPLIYRGKIVGVLSASDDPVKEGRPPAISFYIPVSPNLSWIYNVINNRKSELP